MKLLIKNIEILLRTTIIKSELNYHFHYFFLTIERHFYQLLAKTLLNATLDKSYLVISKCIPREMNFSLKSIQGFYFLHFPYRKNKSEYLYFKELQFLLVFIKNSSCQRRSRSFDIQNTTLIPPPFLFFINSSRPNKKGLLACMFYSQIKILRWRCDCWICYQSLNTCLKWLKAPGISIFNKIILLTGYNRIKFFALNELKVFPYSFLQAFCNTITPNTVVLTLFFNDHITQKRKPIDYEFYQITYRFLLMLKLILLMVVYSNSWRFKINKKKYTVAFRMIITCSIIWRVILKNRSLFLSWK